MFERFKLPCYFALSQLAWGFLFKLMVHDVEMLIFHSIPENIDERSCWADFSVCYTAFLLCLYLSFEELIYNDTVQAEHSHRCTEKFMPK